MKVFYVKKLASSKTPFKSVTIFRVGRRKHLLVAYDYFISRICRLKPTVVWTSTLADEHQKAKGYGKVLSKNGYFLNWKYCLVCITSYISALHKVFT